MQIHFSQLAQFTQTYNWILPINIKAFLHPHHSILVFRDTHTHTHTHTDKPATLFLDKTDGGRKTEKAEEDSHLISMEKCLIESWGKVAWLGGNGFGIN